MSDNDKTRPTVPKKLTDVERWDMAADVLIVGYGGAGACAAIEAGDAGASVIIFEAASAGGGSTALSGGEVYLGGGTRVQLACNYEDTPENMYNYLLAAGGPYADAAKIRAYCEGSVDHFNWLAGHGVPFKDSEYPFRDVLARTDDCLMYTGNEKAWPFNQLAKPVPRGHNIQGEEDFNGWMLIKKLSEAVAARNIPVHCDARVLTLIADENRHVHGLVVRIDQRELHVRAHRGVVLCAGGFVMNRAMVEKYAPRLLKATEPHGNPNDLGAGILMGMGVGGAAINMHDGFVTLPFYPPASMTYGIFVNAQGQRFINEDCYHGRVGHYCLEQVDPRIYHIGTVEDYANYEEVSYMRCDVIATGETIEELEQEIGLPPRSLQQTVATYNGFAEQGEDPLFHKSAEWLKPLKGPFVALNCTPGFGAFYPYFTLGGLDTLPSGEVLTPEGQIIPGLYAAGRTACGVPRTATGYNSGISVGDVTFSGRMAGKAVGRAERRTLPGE